MRYIRMSQITPGMKLGTEIFDSYGRVLLGGKAELTEDYISRLKYLGFDGLYISDELSADISVEPIISPFLRGKGIDCVRRQDIDGCKQIAKEMVAEIIDKGPISIDMTDLRECDDYTYAHSVNVALYCAIIGLSMGMDEKSLEELAFAGLLHDLGKMSIPSEILNKEGRLTQEEYQIMKSHAKISYDAIKERWDVTPNVKVAVLYHHENVDGSGYPTGITGDEMTLYTKIIHVADVFDALLSKRPYKEPYSAYEVSEYMMGACGIMFDTDVVLALLKHVPLYPKGTEMIMSDGRHCIIVENKDMHNLRPIIRLMDGTTINLMDKEYYNITLVAAVSADSISRESEEARNEMIQSYKRYKIMVVDDMVTNLQMIRGILEYFYDLTLLKNGKQALRYLEKNEPVDAIIMDVDMPGMDGIEAARRIKEELHKDIPILFVTTLNDGETVAKCKAVGAAGYIVRPYQPAYIKSEIKRIITGRGDAE
ncbi:MAG: response regulator [Pseudobutyrivibrio sp.]|nr:response regulator [Pseudobutyrivibrio sp.]